MRRYSYLRFRIDQRKTHLDSGATTDSVNGVSPAIVELDSALRNGKPDAKSSGIAAARMIDPIEGRKIASISFSGISGP